jgi:molybdenum cofactor guanylyltransferase
VTQRRAELGAVVLAGGASRRMGTPKALLEWHGSPLVVRVARLLARVAGTVVIVGSPDRDLPAVPGALMVVDASPGRGPLEGIAAGLRALEGRCELAFVAATDLPLLHPAFAQAVLDAAGGFDSAVPESDGRLHPLAAAYRVSQAGRATDLLAAGERRATRFAEGPGTRRLATGDLPHPESLRNMNTPEDYDLLRQLPEPVVHVDGAPFSASTVGRLLEQLGAPPPGGGGLILDGERVDGDPSLPLAEGDELTVA